MSDTPAHDLAARTLAENVYAAYARQASGPLHPQQEQVLLARLAEAIVSAPGAGSDASVCAAANAALDAWEAVEPGVRGPRVERLDAGAAVMSGTGP